MTDEHLYGRWHYTIGLMRRGDEPDPLELVAHGSRPSVNDPWWTL